MPAVRPRPSLGDLRDFFTAYRTSVYAASLAFCGDPETAQDATQEAFVRAYVRWRRLGNEPWVRGWMITTAMNQCRREGARRERAAGTTGRGVAPGFETPAVERAAVLDALRALPPRRRKCAVLFYIADLPVAAVAELMGLSEGGVKSHLAAARRALRDALDDGVPTEERSTG